MKESGYRLNVGLIIANKKGQLLLCKRMGMNSWQFPQGGIDYSEDPLKAAKRAKEVKAAEPIAKPLPIAAVVFPTASSLSVRSLTSLGSSAISAMPPALSAIGPYASTAN